MRSYLKFILQELKPHHRLIFVCMLLAAVGAILDTLGPVAMGRGFDLANEHSSPLLYGGAILAWLIMRSLADLIRTWVANSGGLGVGNDISTSFTAKAAARIIDKPLKFHYGQKIQAIMERVNNFRWSLDSFLNAGLFDLVPSLLALSGILVYLFIINWTIGLTILIALAAYVGFTRLVIDHSFQTRKAWSEADSSFMHVIHDAIRNILLVKSTTNEAAVAKRVAKERRAVMAAANEDIRISKIMLNGQNLIVALATAVTLWLCVRGLAADRLTIGQTSTLIAFTFTVFGYLRAIQWQFRTYLRSIADWQAIMPELELPGEDLKSGRKIEIKGEVEFRDVHFRYIEDRPALEGIDFRVPAGTRVAVVGESGEGKTTLVDLLVRYLTPQAGQVLIDEQDLQQVSLSSLRSQMAYVPQDLTLFHESLIDNIRFGRPKASDKEVLKAAKQAGLTDLIKKLPDGLETVVGERGLKLSGGERQRVALARAFLREPRILILDEPTAHLDSKTEAALHLSLGKLMAGRTVFVIAHRLRTVTDADLILVLHQGRVVEAGTHKQLAAKPDSIYVSLLQAQGLA